MDPATIALIVSTLAQLLGGGETDIEAGATAPAGAGANPTTLDPGAGFVQPSPGTDVGASPITPDTGFLDPLAQQFAAVQAQPSIPAPLAPAAPADGFGPTQAPAAPPAPIMGPPAPAAAPSMGIGEMLAANPEALLALADLLGLGQGEQRTVRPAPTAGGSQGSLIPGLQLPQSGQVGTLLRQIPGLG